MFIKASKIGKRRRRWEKTESASLSICCKDATKHSLGDHKQRALQTASYFATPQNLFVKYSEYW